MHNINNSSRFKYINHRTIKLMAVLTLITQLNGCGNNYPELTQFTVFNERFATVLDTKDADQLKLLSELFFDQQEVQNVQGDLNFIYLFDLTTPSGSERWRCSKNGYCQPRHEGATPHTELYYLERHKELFQVTNLE